jgi:cytochrome c peroxidase
MFEGKSLYRSCLPRTQYVGSILLVGLLAFSSGCKKTVSEMPIGKVVTIKPPLGLPPVPTPSDNPPTAETIALGRVLFYDTRLSKDNKLSCASCHNPDFYFSDGQRLSLGVEGKFGLRNAPTVLNAAYLSTQFWDGRASSLEQQAASPMANPLEMNQPHEVSVSKIAKDPSYKPLFRNAFGSDDVTIGRIEKALASFERTLLSGNSAFDRYKYGGDKTALTPAQIRGLAVFMDPHRGNCVICHAIDDRSGLFTNGTFHNTGEGVDGSGEFTDVGRFSETKVAKDMGSFKTPTLRNVAKTAPYMHDGSLKTLKEVVDFYAGGGNSNPYLASDMKKIKLTGQDRLDLVDFMESLTGDMPPNAGPPGKE